MQTVDGIFTGHSLRAGVAARAHPASRHSQFPCSLLMAALRKLLQDVEKGLKAVKESCAVFDDTFTKVYGVWNWRRLGSWMLHDGLCGQWLRCLTTRRGPGPAPAVAGGGGRQIEGAILRGSKGRRKKNAAHKAPDQSLVSGFDLRSWWRCRWVALLLPQRIGLTFPQHGRRGSTQIWQCGSRSMQVSPE